MSIPRKIIAVLALNVTTLTIAGCGAKRAAAPVPVSVPPERALALSIRANGRVGPADIYPDLSITPGVAASDVTQANIQSTICKAHFTDPPRRPPTSYTNDRKAQGFDDYGLSDRKMGDYEEDHLISLELGGDPRDTRNLWPEPYKASIPNGGARKKDTVEKYLRTEVCHGRMTLAEAQKEIVQDWYKVYLSRHPS
jgi:hypothetical protein